MSASGPYGQTVTMRVDGSAEFFDGVEDRSWLTVFLSGTAATWMQLSNSGDMPSGGKANLNFKMVLVRGIAEVFGGVDDCRDVRRLSLGAAGSTTSTSWMCRAPQPRGRSFQMGSSVRRRVRYKVVDVAAQWRPHVRI